MLARMREKRIPRTGSTTAARSLFDGPFRSAKPDEPVAEWDYGSESALAGGLASPRGGFVLKNILVRRDPIFHPSSAIIAAGSHASSQLTSSRSPHRDCHRTSADSPTLSQRDLTCMYSRTNLPDFHMRLRPIAEFRLCVNHALPRFRHPGIEGHGPPQDHSHGGPVSFEVRNDSAAQTLPANREHCRLRADRAAHAALSLSRIASDLVGLLGVDLKYLLRRLSLLGHHEVASHRNSSFMLFARGSRGAVRRGGIGRTPTPPAWRRSRSGTAGIGRDPGISARRAVLKADRGRIFVIRFRGPRLFRPLTIRNGSSPPTPGRRA